MITLKKEGMVPELKGGCLPYQWMPVLFYSHRNENKNPIFYSHFMQIRNFNHYFLEKLFLTHLF